jgi:hypothetical protein
MASSLLRLGRPQEAQTAARLAQSQADDARTQTYQQQTLELQRQGLGLRQQEAERQGTQFGQTLELQRQRADLEREALGRKPPDVQQVFDEQTGQPTQRQFNPVTRKWEPLGGVKSPAATLQTADKKMIWDSEDTLLNLDATIQDLARAKELAPKAYIGPGAVTRGKVGSWTGIDEGDAKATVELNQLMSPAAIQKMADGLRGATTDRELQRFVDIFADPSSTPDLKIRTIQRMDLLAQRQRQLLTERIGDIKGGGYSLRPGVRQTPAAAALPAVPAMQPPAARIGSAFGTLPAQAAPAPQAQVGSGASIQQRGDELARQGLSREEILQRLRAEFSQ